MISKTIKLNSWQVAMIQELVDRELRNQPVAPEDHYRNSLDLLSILLDSAKQVTLKV